MSSGECSLFSLSDDDDLGSCRSSNSPLTLGDLRTNALTPTDLLPAHPTFGQLHSYGLPAKLCKEGMQCISSSGLDAGAQSERGGHDHDSVEHVGDVVVERGEERRRARISWSI